LNSSLTKKIKAACPCKRTTIEASFNHRETSLNRPLQKRSTRKLLSLADAFIRTMAKPCMQTPKITLRMLLFREHHQVMNPASSADNSKYGNIASAPLPTAKDAFKYTFAVAV
jgi:hypothetical protein